MFDLLKWLEDAPIKLVQGKGSPSTGGCWMSAISLYSGGAWTDHPKCVDFQSYLGPFCIRLNDSLASDSDRGKVIGPHFLAPVGTATVDVDVIERRVMLATNATIKRFLPYALRTIGEEQIAEKLEEMPEIVSFDTDNSKAIADTLFIAACTVHNLNQERFAEVLRAAHVISDLLSAIAGELNNPTRLSVPNMSNSNPVGIAIPRIADIVGFTSFEKSRRTAVDGGNVADILHHNRLGAQGDQGGRIKFACDIVMPVILEMCEIGSKAPIEPAFKDREMRAAFQCSVASEQR